MEKERIKALRQAKGWTWEKMARELGVSWRTVARWEKGETRPNKMAHRILVDQEVKAGLRPSEQEITGRIFWELKENLEAHAGPWEEGEVKALAERTYWLARGEEIIRRITRALSQALQARGDPLTEEEVKVLAERIYNGL